MLNKNKSVICARYRDVRSQNWCHGKLHWKLAPSSPNINQDQDPVSREMPVLNRSCAKSLDCVLTFFESAVHDLHDSASLNIPYYYSTLETISSYF